MSRLTGLLICAMSLVSFSTHAQQRSARRQPPMEVVTVERMEVSEERLRAYEKAMAQELNDPDAARYRGTYVVRHSNGSLFLCGEVNGKNLYGAYTGYQSFAGLIMELHLQSLPEPFLSGVSPFFARGAPNFVTDRCRPGGRFTQPVPPPPQQQRP